MTYDILIKRLNSLKNDLPTHLVEHEAINLALEAIELIMCYCPPSYGSEEYTDQINELRNTN